MVKKVISKHVYVVCFVIGALIFGCGDGAYDDSSQVETGAAEFILIWPDENPDQRTARAQGNPIINCTEKGIENVRVDVYDGVSDRQLEINNGIFPCGDGEGIVDGIPVGSKREFVISALDINGDIRFRGKSGLVTIAKNQVADVGHVEMKEGPVFVRISNPRSGKTYEKYTEVIFSGMWTGEEDRLSSDMPIWTSNIDGEIGSGMMSRISILSEGTHTITLSIKDKYNVTWISTISIVVGAPTSYTDDFGMTFNLIPAGPFVMGSPSNEPGRNDDETQHDVILTRSFYIQTTEVTQGQWEAVLTEAESRGIKIEDLSKTPSYFDNCGEDCPVEEISWVDAQKFINVLNQLGEWTYRLPTEAEWEYAARAGSVTAFANGSIRGNIMQFRCTGDANLSAMGWYCYNSYRTTHPAAQKDPNAWGLYDMHGNVWEWCQDWLRDYPSEVVTDPVGPLSGSERVARGGYWGSYIVTCRSARRYGGAPYDRFSGNGFRLVLLLDEKE